MRRLKVAILVEHVAPWLGANFNAAARVMNCVAVESRSHATHTMHEKVTNGDLFARVPLRTTGVSGATSSLADIRPDVVVTLGWSGARNAAGLSWCLANKVPAVVATDSAQDNFRRTYWRELIKRRIVGLYSAGWAANQAASDYLMALGMQRERVLVGPVDSIDVEHFRSGAKVVRQREEEVRQRRVLPHDYFVAVSRFVPEKNIPTLLVAYAKYKKLVHGEAWKLVLVGAGPVETKIRKLIQKLGIDGDVLLPGHVQFEELPIYYGLAKAFVHASIKDTWGVVVNEAMATGLPVIVSRQCGAARELVKEGVNGFVFDAHDPTALAYLLKKIARGNVDRRRMGDASRELVDRWTPEAYADSLLQVAELACSRPAPKIGISDKALLLIMFGGLSMALTKQ